MGASGRSRRPQAVLFACGWNEVRSPMAAALLRHIVGRSVYVESAGVRRGEPDAFAAAALGYSLADQTVMLNEFTTTGYTVTIVPVELMSVTVE